MRGDAFAGLHTMDKLVGGNGEHVITADLTKAAAAGLTESEQAEDIEDRVGEEAKLGISKRVKAARSNKRRAIRRTRLAPRSAPMS